MARLESKVVRQRKELVLEVLRRRGIATVRDIVEELRRMGYDVKEHNIKYVVKKLVREGKVKQHKCGHNVFYMLADSQSALPEGRLDLDVGSDLWSIPTIFLLTTRLEAVTSHKQNLVLKKVGDEGMLVEAGCT